MGNTTTYYSIQTGFGVPSLAACAHLLPKSRTWYRSSSEIPHTRPHVVNFSSKESGILIYSSILSPTGRSISSKVESPLCLEMFPTAMNQRGSSRADGCNDSSTCAYWLMARLIIDSLTNMFAFLSVGVGLDSVASQRPMFGTAWKCWNVRRFWG